MKDMEYLTEKDLDFFKKKAERGETVIIRLDPEQLLKLDINSFAGQYQSPINENEVRQWLEENHVILQSELVSGDLLQEAKSQETDKGINAADRSLARRLIELHLGDEQSKVIEYAIQKGLSEKQILSFMKEGYSAEKMREICDIMVGLNQ